MTRPVTDPLLTGLDHLLADPRPVAGRPWGLVAHAAAVSRDFQPAHLALAAAGYPPTRLFAPEHGFWGVEQDMVPAPDTRDPLTGLPVASLYGDDEASLRPSPRAFDGLELLVIDLQDVGSRYYTYAATAVWAAEAARRAGCEVLVLDRPNPLGGERVEGNVRRRGFESFVGAFPTPVRHGLTLGELVLLMARRGGWGDAVEVLAVSGWRRSQEWPDLPWPGLPRRPWIAPSPNMPGWEEASVYPGACLVEATELSEGRGTTRPFLWLGSPELAREGSGGTPGALHPGHLAEALAARRLPGVRFVPHFFRPQFQKHAGRLCGGVEWVVTDRRAFRPYRTGVELLAVLQELLPGGVPWRRAPYEFVADRPAVDLLTGDDACRRALEAGDGEALAVWIATWPTDEDAFREERREVLLYPEEGP